MTVPEILTAARDLLATRTDWLNGPDFSPEGTSDASPPLFGMGAAIALAMDPGIVDEPDPEARLDRICHQLDTQTAKDAMAYVGLAARDLFDATDQSLKIDARKGPRGTQAGVAGRHGREGMIATLDKSLERFS